MFVDLVDVLSFPEKRYVVYNYLNKNYSAIMRVYDT